MAVSDSRPVLNPSFVKMLENYNFPPFVGLAEELSKGKSETSIRLNSAKIFCKNSRFLRVKWCDTGFYLKKRPDFIFDPLLHQGVYYMQDASSMAVEAAANQAIASLKAEGGERGLKVLDACAAPGGKSTLLQNLLNEDSVLIANEFDYRRAEILVENIAKWGLPNVIVTRGDTKHYSQAKNYFDIISVDAPCSGEGMMRKSDEAITQWSEQLIITCAERQKNIIKNLWPALKPGGFLIYSTCTFNTSENEEIVKWILENFDAIPQNIRPLDGIGEIAGAINCNSPVYRFIPGKIRGEGQFIALLRKSEGKSKIKEQKKPNKHQADKQLRCLAEKALGFKSELATLRDPNIYYALPVYVYDSVSYLQSLRNGPEIIYAGVELAELAGKKVVPAEPLALSTAFKRDTYPTIELSYKQALRYLRGEVLTDLNEGSESEINLPKGYITVCYKGRPLGFVNNLGSRANNMYPKPWRIVNQITSERLEKASNETHFIDPQDID